MFEKDSYLLAFGQRLKTAREAQGLSQQDLAEKVGTSKSMISAYENGQSDPRQSVIPVLAKSLRVSIEWLITGESNHTNNYRAEISLQIYQTVNLMGEMNSDGQDKVLDQAKLLKQSGLYDAEKVIEFNEEQFVSLYTIGSAAAGSGFTYGDEINNYRVIMTTEIPKHDFTIDVVGDSMFPTIYDGDVAFVKQTVDHIDKRIYVLDIDGETVIKRVVFGDNEITLISDNPDWDDRIVTGQELASTRLLGEVIGWETPVQ
ncbi:MAG: XRE family transcriptional regulator [Eubacteriales bacterium]|nr:XRE family transcriptional regulator [Eubacteriales bacterium]